MDDGDANSNMLDPVMAHSEKKSLTSQDKLKLKSEFAYVRENGTKFVGKYLILVTAVPPDNKLRCGVICGRKFSKKAVIRNRARRLLWESIRLLKANITPAHLVMITRSWIKGRKQQQVQEDLQELLKKAGLFHP